MVVKKRDVISMLDLKDDLQDVLGLAAELKKGKYRNAEPLKGKTMAMIFEKASTRTRVSFEVGMTQLGGHAIFLSPRDMQLGRGETVADTAKVSEPLRRRDNVPGLQARDNARTGTERLGPGDQRPG